MLRASSLARLASLCAALAAAPVLAQHRSAPPPGVAHYDVHADRDRVHLLVGERVAHGIALRHRRSDDGGATWSAPTAVGGDAVEIFSPHPGEHPQIAARGDRVLALWTTRDTETKRGGPIAGAVSSDGGASWRPVANPAGSSSAGYHGLIEIAADGDAFHAVWLRPSGQEAAVTQGLHYARSTDGEHWDAVATLDADTCRCCWNRVVATGDGVGVLYRDGKPRDMAFAVLANGAWREPVAAGRFDWGFEGCPHVGGALTSDGKRAVDALVWTGVDGERTGLYYLGSRDGGASFGDLVRLGDATARESDLARDGKRLVALFNAGGPGASAIKRAESDDAGRRWSASTVASAGTGFELVQPRLAATSHGLATFWLERSREGTVLYVNGARFSSAAAAGP